MLLSVIKFHFLCYILVTTCHLSVEMLTLCHVITVASISSYILELSPYNFTLKLNMANRFGFEKQG